LRQKATFLTNFLHVSVLQFFLAATESVGNVAADLNVDEDCLPDFYLGPKWAPRLNACLANPMIASIEWCSQNLSDQQVQWLLGFNSIDYPAGKCLNQF
jgi:hypothetical protein